MKNQIHSKIEIVAIDEVECNLDQIKNNCFTKSELFELENKHIQTLAGLYVLKIALKKLINEQNTNQTISEKQIILKHNPHGAPCISKVNSFLYDDYKQIHISISHTSKNVYGFASVMESKK